MSKRSFYNTGDAKGFTKAAFFQAVLDMANGVEIADAQASLIAAAAEYELEGIANRAEKAAGEAKDPMQSNYAIAILEAFLPLLSDKPQTLNELIEKAEKKAIASPTGKDWSAAWVARVLNKQESIEQVEVIVDHVDKNGLKQQRIKKAYKKA